MYAIQQREVPEQAVVTEQRHVAIAELPDFIDAAMGRLMETVKRHGGVAAAPCVIYHGEVNEDSYGPLEVCMPIDPASATAEMATRREPAFVTYPEKAVVSQASAFAPAAPVVPSSASRQSASPPSHPSIRVPM